ncbi:aspartate-semialdehyde dehydrogenase [Candidatus Odyssella thessalonicensis]|uniref:aspartate-semialdehyde dehydrogenase n=1 Tax=Candidatus Odyssella thessalonicensis TaxID=84647 RepID=UPI000225ACBE|nr:aspartate-semialdehyde dehydrogenase [Candidatus Odyssella thessalonicensis]
MSKKSSIKIAVVGATGNVGRTFLQILAERGYPAKNITAIASNRSANRPISYGDNDILTVQALENFDFSGYDFALFSPGAAISADYAPKAAAQGCVVIDNTSHFRMHSDIPLVIPEINAHTLETYQQRNIIANPNCSTIQLLMALKPLHDIAKIKRVVVSTYQSVSGGGQEAMDELTQQTKGLFTGMNVPPERFTKPIAFNVIPHIDPFQEDNYTKEEWKMRVETQKILDPSIKLTATCVRVPVYIGHSVAANVEFESELLPESARQALRKAKGITVMDNPEDLIYATPLDSVGENDVFVSRIRQDTTVNHGLDLWIVSDNVRKGAALNAIQIMEHLI